MYSIAKSFLGSHSSSFTDVPNLSTLATANLVSPNALKPSSNLPFLSAMAHENFKIHLINTRSLVKETRKLELQKHIQIHRPDVILITETALKTRNKFSLPGFNIIRNDRIGQKGGGTAIAYRETFLHDDIFLATPVTTFEFTAIALNCVCGAPYTADYIVRGRSR